MIDIESFTNSKILQKARQLKEANLYSFFRAIDSTDASTVTVKGKRQVMVGSNNYLGLTHHPYVKEAAITAIEKFGTGCTGSRFLNGNLTIHEELEEKLAKYVGHESALVFSTGMQTNLGSISSTIGMKDCFISDAENHASIIDAQRLSRAANFKFKHNNMADLEDQLETNVSRFERTMIIADGVFSMTGDIINLPKVIELAKKYKVMVYVDDAHGLGVIGPQGRGTMAHFGLTNDVDLNMGTFSKSFASIGGFISGRSEIIDFIKHSARSFMFSASMPPSAVATVSACIDVVQRDESVLKNLWENVNFMQKGFKEIGFYTFNSQTPIIPIFIGDELKAMQVTQFLQEHGVFATPVITPAVNPEDALIRTSYMSSHNKKDLTYVLEVFEKAKKAFDIPNGRH